MPSQSETGNGSGIHRMAMLSRQTTPSSGSVVSGGIARCVDCGTEVVDADVIAPPYGFSGVAQETVVTRAPQQHCADVLKANSSNGAEVDGKPRMIVKPNRDTNVTSINYGTDVTVSNFRPVCCLLARFVVLIISM